MNKRKLTALISCAAFGLAGLTQAAFARDLTVVSWGGNYQDAQKKIYFEPFRQTDRQARPR